MFHKTDRWGKGCMHHPVIYNPLILFSLSYTMVACPGKSLSTKCRAFSLRSRVAPQLIHIPQSFYSPLTNTRLFGTFASLFRNYASLAEIPPAKSSLIAINCSKAACKSSTILAASMSGGGKVSAPSRLSSRSQNRSRLTLSRLSNSS
jgi:hypothetical protein